MANNFKPAQTGFSRVHLIEGRARPDHVPGFQSCLRAGPLEYNFGDITKIECPDPDNFNGFIEVGTIQGERERPSTNLMGRYAADLRSDLLRLARVGCPSDAHINFGECTDPRDNSTFTKKLILEDLRFTAFSTGELGAIGSGDRAAIDETGEVSAKDAYEVLRLAFAERGGSIITSEVIDVVICGNPSCGDCEGENDGCKKIFALTLAAGGSPSTPADIVYSLDKGKNWQAVDIDTLGAAEQPTALTCVGQYLVVVSADSNSLHYAPLSDFDTVPNVTWTEVSTGFVTGGGPQDIWSIGNTAFIAGNGGYIYKCTDPTAGVTVLDAGVAVTDTLNAVHALSEDLIVAVGNAGRIVYSENGTTFQQLTPSPVGVGVNLNCVWAKKAKEWFIGGSNGRLYYTTDRVNWTEKSFTGSGAGQVRDIAFASDSVVYLSHSTATPAGRLLRSYDGGQFWKVLPETTGNLPANGRMTAIAACKHDVNFVVGGGLADNGTDGFLVVGSD